jgi:O-antigen/teichoic acid export membrane protein
MAGSNISEQAQTAFERTWLAVFNSVSAVGLWGHAMQYRQYAMIGLNAVSRAVWPVNLDESRSVPPTFPLTRLYWSTVQIGVIILGVAFGLVGREAIGLLTHNRFSSAAPFAAIGLLSLLIQTAGKAQIALLVAHGRGVALSHTQTLSAVVRVVMLAALVPMFGMLGAAGALLAQQVAVRVLVWRAAKHIAHTPFLDHWVLAGCAVIPACVGFAASGLWPWPARAALAAAIALAFAFAGRNGVLAFFTSGHESSLPLPPPAEVGINGASNG